MKSYLEIYMIIDINSCDSKYTASILENSTKHEIFFIFICITLYFCCYDPKISKYKDNSSFLMIFVWKIIIGVDLKWQTNDDKIRETGDSFFSITWHNNWHIYFWLIGFFFNRSVLLISILPLFKPWRLKLLQLPV